MYSEILINEPEMEKLAEEFHSKFIQIPRYDVLKQKSAIEKFLSEFQLLFANRILTGAENYSPTDVLDRLSADIVRKELSPNSD